MNMRNTHETLRHLQGGTFIDQCDDELKKLVRNVDETGKSGKITITLELKKSNGAVAINASVVAKIPQPKPDADLLWPTVEGNLSLDNPSQRKLDLKPVETPRLDIKVG